MLDTIVLLLKENMFSILNHDKFTPSTRGLFDATDGYYRMGGRANITCKQNPTKNELKQGFYKPRLTVTKRVNREHNFEITLKIEFSAPKLLYGNNFDELSDSDFSLVVDKLLVVLKEMGVYIFEEKLTNAPVSAIHYSKNIPLTDGSTPHYLISKIKEANIKLSLDVNQTDYRNDGHSYKWHCNSYEVAFYDKIKDIEVAKISDKRAIEDDNTIQLNIFDAFQKRKNLEVLRMEIRLNKKQKIGKLFRDLGINVELAFQNLFSSTISQKILLYYLDEIERQRPRVLDLEAGKPKELLTQLIINNPKLGLLKTLQIFGLKQSLDTVTPRELRSMFGKYSQRSWYRLISDAKNVNLPVTTSPFGVIRNNLNNFEPLKLVDFQNKMINNDKYQYGG